jgi:hypothetical protein
MVSAQQQLLGQGTLVRLLQPKPIRVSPVIGVTLLMLISFFIVSMSLVLTARSLGVRFDPLNAYASILPGQPWANAEAFGFECGTYNHGDYHVEDCTLRPETGTFARIGAVKFNGVI